MWQNPSHPFLELQQPDKKRDLSEGIDGDRYGTILYQFKRLSYITPGFYIIDNPISPACFFLGAFGSTFGSAFSVSTEGASAMSAMGGGLPEIQTAKLPCMIKTHCTNKMFDI